MNWKVLPEGEGKRRRRSAAGGSLLLRGQRAAVRRASEVAKCRYGNDERDGERETVRSITKLPVVFFFYFHGAGSAEHPPVVAAGDDNGLSRCRLSRVHRACESAKEGENKKSSERKQNKNRRRREERIQIEATRSLGKCGEKKERREENEISPPPPPPRTERRKPRRLTAENAIYLVSPSAAFCAHPTTEGKWNFSRQGNWEAKASHRVRSGLNKESDSCGSGIEEGCRQCTCICQFRNFASSWPLGWKNELRGYFASAGAT